jgi:16S rRNA C967 or C1407 C5-methylase (RsmB/RsmF family)
VEGFEMKVIQVPMKEKLLEAVNRKARARRSTRAALIRAACEEYLRRLEEEELDRRYVDGYRRKPESPIHGKLGEKMAGEVWPKEDWDEAW